MKIMINGQILHQSNIFAVVLTHANLVSSFRCSKYLPKIRFSNMYLFEYKHLKRFCLKRLGIGYIFQTGRFPMAEKRMRQHIFFS